MVRRPPRSTRTDTLLPYTTLFRSPRAHGGEVGEVHAEQLARHQVGRAVEEVPPRDHGVDGGDQALARPDRQHGRIVVEPEGAVRLRRQGGEVALDQLELPDAPALLSGGPLLSGDQGSGPGLAQLRSEERRVGNECVSTCRSRWSPYH